MRRVTVLLAVGLLVGCSTNQSVPTPTQSPSPQVSYDDKARPLRSLTPGAFNLDVTQATIKQTICVAGWTRTVRPPVSYTNALKLKQITLYGYSDHRPQDYEEDHLIPLELGGAPSDPRNLWPEPGPSPNPKDKEENELRNKVCGGSMTLAQARNKILADWGPTA